MLHAVQERVDWIMNHPADTSMRYSNKQCWTWCDALFMAPLSMFIWPESQERPAISSLCILIFCKLIIICMTGLTICSFVTTVILVNKKRMAQKSFGAEEMDGFWQELPIYSNYYPKTRVCVPFYVQLFVELAAQLSKLQDDQGFWHASLLDPDSYPSPETSSTALITYGLAYGLNHHLLDTSYLPVVRKAWKALTSTVDQNGKVGWVQPIGADPKKVTREMTAVYGVGAFLMAGTEIIKLIE